MEERSCVVPTAGCRADPKPFVMDRRDERLSRPNLQRARIRPRSIRMRMPPTGPAPPTGVTVWLTPLRRRVSGSKRLGEEMSVNTKHIAWLGLAAGILLYASPARSTTPPPVGVSLTISDTLHRVSCKLTVPVGSNGLALFGEAQRSRCITSYTTYYPGKSYLSCVRWDRRGQHVNACEGGGIGIVKQWSAWENGSESSAYSRGGLEALHNDAGDHYVFSLHLVCCYG